MNEQKFTKITASYKNTLVKFAKRNKYKFNVEKKAVSFSMS